MREFYNSKEKHKYGDMSYESQYLSDPKYMAKRDLQNYYRYYNLTKNRSQYKKIVLLIICICFFLYIFVDYNLKNKFNGLRDRFDYISHVNTDYNISQPYFVNTPGCQMPHFDVTNDNILQYMYNPQNYTCKKPLTRSSDEGAQIWLNMNETELMEYFNISNIETISCEYTQIKRKTDEHNEYLERVEFNLELNKSVHIKPGFNFIRIECYNAEGQSIYKDFHFFIQNQNQTKKYENRKQQKSAHNERVSVMIFGIDSVSHLNFLRQMRKTADYIHNKLTHVEFWGYNKVGDNTYPNLVPVLSGLDESELNLSCLMPVKQVNYDKCAFIWKRFKAQGFSTVYAEDVASLGLFNFFRPGFMQQPTDYYLRPIMLEMEQHISYKQSVNVELCKGGRQTAGVVLEMMRKLIPLLKYEYFFSFFWTVTLTHDLLNMPRLLDDDIVQLFETFHADNILNNSVILLMSDHGLRWGSFRKTYQGMMEERQPLLIALLPNWFKTKYPKAMANMQLNAKRLTTPFDVYETLLDLLHIENNLHDIQINAREADLSDTENMPRGISLFLPIPESRSCENAAIAAHWCTCHQRQELATNDARVQRAARYIVRLINERIKAYTKCRTLYLNAIVEANIAAPHHKIVKELSDYGIDITLRVQTKPGLGLFESTVRMLSDNIVLTGTISRINLYSSQSFCISDTAIKMFCYCHR